MTPQALAAPVAVAPTTIIGEHCSLGAAKEARLRSYQATGYADPPSRCS